MEGPEIKATEAIIDNGKFGKRVIRFETGRLAQQAQGAAAVYIDEETMLFSATTASQEASSVAKVAHQPRQFLPAV
jgi:polyribonucleotide nucleotidyltransferase